MHFPVLLSHLLNCPGAAGAPDEVPTSDGAAAGEQAATIRVKLNTNNAKNKYLCFHFFLHWLNHT